MLELPKQALLLRGLNMQNWAISFQKVYIRTI